MPNAIETIRFRVDLLDNATVNVVEEPSGDLHGNYDIARMPDALRPLLIGALKAKSHRAISVIQALESTYGASY